MKILLFIALFCAGAAVLTALVTAASYWLTWALLNGVDKIMRRRRKK